jgi:zinc transport system permease protein
VVAVAIKVVGVLLIAAMLIVPAAAARPLAGTPERMALIATGIAAAAALGGLAASFRLDTPTGPTIVCVAALIFVLTMAGNTLRGFIGNTG